MYDLDPLIAREMLLSLFGVDEYNKFVAALNGRCVSKHRLLYWQEVMWKKVQDELGVRIEDFKTVRSLFQHCHIHGNELEPDRVPIEYGTRKFTGAYIEAQEELFPQANDVVYGPCWEEQQRTSEVLFCSECRLAKRRWLSHGNGT